MSKEPCAPIVSVIVPIYKVEKYLRECLDSVVCQTLCGIEVICIDDGSPDRSADIAAEYVEKYDNVKMIRKENGGLSSARNAGLDAAAGRYVYFLDSDDYIEPDTLERLCTKADAEDLDIIYFNAQVFFENEQAQINHKDRLNYYSREHDYSGLCTGRMMFLRMRKYREYLPSVCIQLFRRSLIEENSLRFRRGTIHEDNLFSFQCMFLAQKVDYVSDAFFHRRVRDGSIMTGGESMRNVEGYLAVYTEILAFLHGHEIGSVEAGEISEYLYANLLGNVRRIYRNLEDQDDDIILSKDGFGTAHTLNVAKRIDKLEFDYRRTKQENRELCKKVNDERSACNSLKAERSELQKRLRDIKTEHDRLKESSAEMQRRLQAVESERDHLKVTSADLRKQLQSAVLDCDSLKAKNAELSGELRLVKTQLTNSISYRTSAFFKKAAAKIAGGVQCAKDHGLAYTINRAGGMVWNKLKRIVKGTMSGRI